jgi:predicted secreted hydrolase
MMSSSRGAGCGSPPSRGPGDFFPRYTHVSRAARAIGAQLTCFLLLSALHAQTSAQSPFETATPGYHYAFPRDHFKHEHYQTEWWYYTGNVVTGDGQRFGYELTFFRQASKREKEKSKTWDMQDLYLAHLAFSDLAGGKFYHTERLNREGPGIAGASEAEQKVWNGNWQVKWNNDDQQLQAIDKDFTLDLHLHSEKPPVIHGENGVSQKSAGAGHASHYISLTRLNTSGEIQLEGKTFRVSGLSWMDHEFFTTQLDTGRQGWDWMAIQLNDGTEVMLYHFRRQDGSRDPFSSGTYVDAQGRTTHLNTREFILEPIGATWTSALTKATYPVSWKIQIPQLALALEAKTVLPNQELATESNLAPSYWEGAITLSGTRNSSPLTGVGYLELTGYDHSMKLP